MNVSKLQMSSPWHFRRWLIRWGWTKTMVIRKNKLGRKMFRKFWYSTFSMPVWQSGPKWSAVVLLSEGNPCWTLNFKIWMQLYLKAKVLKDRIYENPKVRNTKKMPWKEFLHFLTFFLIYHRALMWWWSMLSPIASKLLRPQFSQSPTKLCTGAVQTITKQLHIQNATTLNRSGPK